MRLFKICPAYAKRSAVWGITDLPGIQLFYHQYGQQDSYACFQWSGWVIDLESDETPWIMDIHTPSYQVAKQLIGQQFHTRKEALSAIELARQLL